MQTTAIIINIITFLKQEIGKIKLYFDPNHLGSINYDRFQNGVHQLYKHESFASSSSSTIINGILSLSLYQCFVFKQFTKQIDYYVIII